VGMINQPSGQRVALVRGDHASYLEVTKDRMEPDAPWDESQSTVDHVGASEPSVEEEKVTDTHALISKVAGCRADLTERWSPVDMSGPSDRDEIRVEVSTVSGDPRTGTEIFDDPGIGASVVMFERVIRKSIERRGYWQAQHRSVGKYRARVPANAAVETLAAENDLQSAVARNRLDFGFARKAGGRDRRIDRAP